MKKLKALLVFACFLAAIVCFNSCSAANNEGGMASGGESYAPGDGYYGVPEGGGFDADYSGGAGGSLSDPDSGDVTIDKSESADDSLASDGDASENGATDGDKDESAPEIITRPAGLITASAWNDNDNYEFFKQNFEQSADGNGKFAEMTGEFGLNSLGRRTVKVTSSGAAVAGARVVAKNENGEIVFSALTDAAGKAYLFGGSAIVSATVTSGDFSETATFGENTDIEVELSGAASKRDIIDIMFVIDATGSMGDELYYLQNEINDVIGRIAEANSEAIVNLAILFYRDEVDEEEFVYFDFVDVTASEGLSLQKAALDSCEASGGGDYPEELDEALLLAVDKQWSSGASTKLIFLVLDAPCHTEDEDKKNFSDAVNLAAERGIRICPILCSGADNLTEYLSRQAAILTGGTFIFVTDDSGIGGAHHDPSIPNAVVEALNDLMVRLVNGYHTGVFEKPVNWRDTVNNSK